MNKGLDFYKAFIDGLVQRKNSAAAKWITGGGYPETEDNTAVNSLLSSLNAEQKEVLAEMVQGARESGIHDTLAYINEKMDTENLVIIQDGESFPHDEFDSMHFDFVCRCEGDEWPE